MFAVAKLRPIGRFMTNRNVKLITQKRLSSDMEGWSYRRNDPCPHKYKHICAEGIMGFMWYWMFFHLYYDFGHIVGHFDYPDPDDWTDAELGIPSESM